MQEPDPWIRIQLSRDFFIYKVRLTSSYDSIQSPFLVYVVPNDVTDSTVTCNRNKKRTGLVFDCVPAVNASAVQVTLKGNFTLVICDVYISGMGEALVLYFS